MMLKLVISRAEAKAQGMTLYFTGQPCKYGHIVERYVCNYTCMTCRLIGRQKWMNVNRERHNKATRLYYHKHKDQARARHKKWRQANPSKTNEHSKRWRQKHPNYRGNYETERAHIVKCVTIAREFNLVPKFGSIRETYFILRKLNMVPTRRELL